MSLDYSCGVRADRYYCGVIYSTLKQSCVCFGLKSTLTDEISIKSIHSIWAKSILRTDVSGFEYSAPSFNTLSLYVWMSVTQSRQITDLIWLRNADQDCHIGTFDFKNILGPLEKFRKKTCGFFSNQKWYLSISLQ